MSKSFPSPLHQSLKILSLLYGFDLSEVQLQNLLDLKEIPAPQRLARIQKIVGPNPPSEYIQLVNFLLDAPPAHQTPLTQFLTTSTSAVTYPLSEQDPSSLKILSSGLFQIIPSLPPSLSGLAPLLPHLLLADPSPALSALIDLIYTLQNS